MRCRVPTLVVVVATLWLAGCHTEGRRVYIAEGCEECHGVDMGGTMTGGPALRRTRSHWNEDRLLRYFANPDSVVAKDPRLAELREMYGSGMPPVTTTVPRERRALARYVLR